MQIRRPCYSFKAHELDQGSTVDRACDPPPHQETLAPYTPLRSYRKHPVPPQVARGELALPDCCLDTAWLNGSESLHQSMGHHRLGIASTLAELGTTLWEQTWGCWTPGTFAGDRNSLLTYGPRGTARGKGFQVKFSRWSGVGTLE